MALMVSVYPKNVKVNYNSHFAKNGTHYDQMVTLALTKEQVRAFANMVIDTLGSKGVSEYTKMHLKRVNFGDNYTNLTTFDYFTRFFHPLLTNKRIKLNRNTILRIIEG